MIRILIEEKIRHAYQGQPESMLHISVEVDGRMVEDIIQLGPNPFRTESMLEHVVWAGCERLIAAFKFRARQKGFDERFRRNPEGVVKNLLETSNIKPGTVRWCKTCNANFQFKCSEEWHDWEGRQV